MFFEQLKKICNEKGTSPSAAATAIGLSKSAVTRWKNGQEPVLGDAVKLAEFLGVDISELVETEKAPAEAEADEDTELIEMLEEVRRNPDLKILFSLSKNAKPEDIKKTIKIIKTISGEEDGRSNY